METDCRSRQTGGFHAGLTVDDVGRVLRWKSDLYHGSRYKERNGKYVGKTSLNVTRRIMCVCLEDLPKIYLLFIILYSDDSCEGAGGGLIKSHYCPY